MIIVAKFSSLCPACEQRIMPGSKIEWIKGEKGRHVECPPAGAGAQPAPKAKSTSAPRCPRLPDHVGERGEFQAEFRGAKSDRAPIEQIGETRWLRSGKALIACVVVGYSPALYVRSDDAEDMGHFGVESGYYGAVDFRAATPEEYEALQVRAPRPEGTCLAAVSAVVDAIRSIARVA